MGRHYEFTVDVVSTADAIELKTLIAQARRALDPAD